MDNTTLPSGSGGDTVRTEDRSGVKTQVVGIDLDIGGASEKLMTSGQKAAADSLPVVLASDQPAVPVSVSGTVAVASVGGAVEIANDAGSPVPVSGTVTITDGGGSVTVDGPLTDSQLRAAAVPVSLASVPSHAVTNAGTFAVQAAQSGTWNVGTVTTVTTVSDAQVQGKAAHDAAASGNPVLAGLEGRRARATAVSADGDVARAAGDRYGRQAVIGVPLTIAAVDASNSGDTDVVPAASIGAGNRCKLIRVEASNTHATTALTVGLKSASLNGGTVFGKKYLPAAGGLAVWNFPGGYLEAGDNEAIKVNLSGAGAVSVTAYFELVAS